MNKIIIRRAKIDEVDKLRYLYRDTVIHINSFDYTPDEIKAWVGTSKNSSGLKRKFSEQYFIAAEVNGIITGFSSITDEGYLDFMYVHKDYQRIGIGTALLNEIETHAMKIGVKEIYSHVSKTALPFFEKNGYFKKGTVINKVNNVEFVNSVMIKVL